MPATTVTASGKIILFGEHAVVYGFPAIAVPIDSLSARVVITPLIGKPSGTIEIEAPEINLFATTNNLPVTHAIKKAIDSTIDDLGLSTFPSFKIHISSTIPLSSGLGSGAAVSVAIIKGVSRFLGHPLPLDNVNKIAFEVEKIHHGTPSGIDNTVITYQQPVYFVKDSPLERLIIKGDYFFLVGDTGVRSSTRAVVGDLRNRWEKDNQKFDNLFVQCGDIAQKAKIMLEKGNSQQIGEMMDQNHQLLMAMGVSSTELDKLVKVAKQSGAIGAKMSGGGWGGNMIALIRKDQQKSIENSLHKAGAKNVYKLHLGQL